MFAENRCPKLLFKLILPKTLINLKNNIRVMKKIVLPNGLTIIYKHRKGDSVVIEALVKVGSNHEQKQERGISHFLEHILFEGTAIRPTNTEVSNEIEKVGGDLNAYTSNEKTCFHIKVLKKHFFIAVDVIMDILQHPLFKEKDIVKEKKVVLKEIDMVNDEPKYYQWLILQKILFDKHPCMNPTYGDKNVIKNLTRDKLIGFFKKYYRPNNMIISIVGDIKDWRKLIEKRIDLERGNIPRISYPHETVLTKNKAKKVQKNILNTHLVIGFRTVPRSHQDSYVLDVINGILGRGQSGKVFTEIRSKRGLAYDVGTQSIAEKSFGYFAAYATINKKNVKLVKELILTELKKLKSVSQKEINEAKDYIEGDYLLSLEDTQKVADQLLFWEQVQDAEMIEKYVKSIRQITASDVSRVIKKYFQHYAIVILEGNEKLSK